MAERAAGSRGDQHRQRQHTQVPRQGCQPFRSGHAGHQPASRHGEDQPCPLRREHPQRQYRSARQPDQQRDRHAGVRQFGRAR